MSITFIDKSGSQLTAVFFILSLNDRAASQVQRQCGVIVRAAVEKQIHRGLMHAGDNALYRQPSGEGDSRDEIKMTLDNDTFENTGKSRFFERRTSRVLY